jgi:hypothetical protein
MSTKFYTLDLWFVYFCFWSEGFWFRLWNKRGFVFSKTQLFSDRYFKRKKYFGYYIRKIDD